MVENLWLNLGTGHIGSGRRQWDGSGGQDGVRGREVTIIERIRSLGDGTAAAARMG
jgi:uncharacterized UBP type Zn finger protein